MALAPAFECLDSIRSYSTDRSSLPHIAPTARVRCPRGRKASQQRPIASYLCRPFSRIRAPNFGTNRTPSSFGRPADAPLSVEKSSDRLSVAIRHFRTSPLRGQKHKPIPLGIRARPPRLPIGARSTATAAATRWPRGSRNSTAAAQGSASTERGSASPTSSRRPPASGSNPTTSSRLAGAGRSSSGRSGHGGRRTRYVVPLHRDTQVSPFSCGSANIDMRTHARDGKALDFLAEHISLILEGALRDGLRLGARIGSERRRGHR
ncbi:MAG: hypothetical protein RL199_379 [Pseudomonadota bacterium]|jgi:hypothetical protein